MERQIITFLNQKVSENFKYYELIKSNTAKRLGIKNFPNQQQFESLELVVKKILQPVRYAFGPIKITSGFRSVELCEAIGSSSTSNHTRGEAIDFEPVNSDVEMIDIVRWIHDNCDYREMIAEYFPDGWIHVAYRENANIRKLKLKDSDHNYSLITIDDLKEIY